ncbi:MAG: IPT/TIG domain-containing protein, partial [Phycisphaerales bacterium]
MTGEVEVADPFVETELAHLKAATVPETYAEVEIRLDDWISLEDVLALPQAPGGIFEELDDPHRVVVQVPSHVAGSLIKEGTELSVLRRFILVEGGVIDLDTEDGTGSTAGLCTGGEQFGQNSADVAIPDYPGGWVYSPITLSGAPSGMTVTCLDVHYEIIHTYRGDLNVDLNDENISYNHDLWGPGQGGSTDNINETVTGIHTFDGEYVNQTWKLYVRDEAGGDVGYIDTWWLKVYYDAPTTIWDAWWTDQIDTDGDGYRSSARLNWDPDIVGCSGSVEVYEKVYWMRANSGVWNLSFTNWPHTLTDCISGDSASLNYEGGQHDLYDWKIEIYRTGEHFTPDYTRGPANDGDLNDYKMELPSEELVPTVWGAWWTEQVDLDGDGCVRSARINWDTDVVGCSGSLSVVDKLYYRPAAGGAWSQIAEVGPRTINDCYSADATWVSITYASACGPFDYKIDVYYAGGSSPVATAGPSDDPDLNDHLEESPPNDCNAAMCSDGIFCNGVEYCDAMGNCQPGGNPCPGQLCRERDDRCVDCLSQSDCLDAFFCNGVETCDEAGYCHPGDDPCPRQLCRESDDQCVDCLSHSDCTDGLFCNGQETCNAAGACVAGADPCPGQMCRESDNTCVECLSDPDCSDGLFCTGAETCDAAGDCRPGAPPCPPDWFCVEPSDIPGGCFQCLTDTHCRDDLYCNGLETCSANGFCQPGTSPCAADEACDETSDRCDPDCNNNGISDIRDIESGTSHDCNTNLIPDECDPDGDGDTIPDDCDVCPRWDDRVDSDEDGTPDGCDLCPGFDDRVDSDRDTVPDGCDQCPNGDDINDADGDGVPDGCDECPGMDDNATIGPPFAVSTGATDAGRPDAAFNTANTTWLVVWREASQTHAGAGRVMARVVDDDETPLTSPAALSALRNDMSAPRVSYDPVGNEWLVVWSAGGFPIEGGGELAVYARRVSASGTVIGTQPGVISPSGVGEANPDVAAGSYQVDADPATSYYFIVWEDIRDFASTDDAPDAQRRVYGKHVLADATAGPGHIRLSDLAAFRLDSLGTFPLQPYHCRDPRIADPSPSFTTVSPPPHQSSVEETAHQVVFDAAYGGTGSDTLYDIYLAAVSTQGLGSVTQITETEDELDNEPWPVIAWSQGPERGMVLFLHGSETYGQLFEVIGLHTGHQLLATDFLVSSSDYFSLDAHPLEEDFFLGNHIPAGADGWRIAGHHVYSLFGNLVGQEHPSISMDRNTGDCYLLAYVSPGTGPDTILARTHCGCWGGPNHSPTADAGPDLTNVYEGTHFNLDGSGSTDPDGDPRIYSWAQTGGADDAKFIDADETTKESPQLIAPTITTGDPSETLEFELTVDDLRIPGGVSQDYVNVTVIPADDANPPIAIAGSDQTVDEDVQVQLDGCASSDPDPGDTPEFLWEFISTTPDLGLGDIKVAPLTSCNPYFKTPRFANQGGIDLLFRLRVNSPRGGVDTDTVTIHVNDSVNEPPTADAGDDMTVFEHSAFFLNGSGTDPNGDPPSYSWVRVTSLDAGEDATINPPTVGMPSVTASVNADRDIVFRLTVSDGRNGMDSDEVTVHVQALPMQVWDFTPKQGSPGTEVTISGSDLNSVTSVSFNGYGGSIESRADAELKVIVPSGSESRRSYNAGFDLGWLDVLEYFDVTTGPLVVQDAQTSWTSPTDFEVSHARLHQVILTQGLGSYDFVRGKGTLLQVQLRTQEPAPAVNAGLSAATCYVIPSSGTPFTLQADNVPSTSLTSTLAVSTINEGVNFFLPGDKLTAPRYKFWVTVTHNEEEVLHFESMQNSDLFEDVITPRFLVRPVVPFVAGSVDPTFDWGDYWRRYHLAVNEFKRIYPVAGVDFIVGPTVWSGSKLLGNDGKVHFDWNPFRNFPDDFPNGMLPAIISMRNYLDDWNGNNPNRQAITVTAAIDKSLYAGGAPGFGVPPRSMMARIVKFAITEKIPVLGPVVDFFNDVIGGLVCGLTFGLWCPDPIEEVVKAFFGLIDVFGIEIGGKTAFVVLGEREEELGTTTILHNWGGKTLSHEIGHNLGFVDPYAYNHDDDEISHSMYDEKKASFADVAGVYQPIFNVSPPGELLNGSGYHRAQSLMSYADYRQDGNVFFEPPEYDELRDHLMKPPPSGSLR